MTATCGISNGRPKARTTPGDEETAVGWLTDAGGVGAAGEAGMPLVEPAHATTRTPASAAAADTATDRTELRRPAGDLGASRAAQKWGTTLNYDGAAAPCVAEARITLPGNPIAPAAAAVLRVSGSLARVPSSAGV